MKKQLILILSLVLLLAATAGVLLLVSHMENQQQEEADRLEQEKVMISVSSSDVDKIEIHASDADYIATLDEHGKWELENDVDFEINTYYLNSMASSLAALTADEIVGSVADSDLSSYGLEDPETTIVLYEGETAQTISVGKLSATKEYYYVTMEGRDEIFAVSTDYSDYLTVNKNSLKSIYILRNSSSDILEISLEAHGEMVYQLQSEDGGLWEMTYPLELTDRVDNSGVNSLLITINQMIIDRFGDENVTEDQYAAYGFDDPAYIFWFRQEDGETTTLLVQDYDADTGYVCVLCKETGQIFYMESTYADFLQDTAEQFVQSLIYSCPVSEIAQVDVQWDAREDAEISIDEENGDYVMNGVVLADVGTDAVSALEDFYTKIQALKYDTLVAENPVKETAEPMATFTYTKKDDTTCEVSFYPVDDDTLAVYIDGTYAYFTISTKNFTARDGVYDMYDQLLSAAGIE